jgi:hypothetical protein
VQFDFPGALGVPDGRYLARDGSGAEGQRVLVVETLGGPPPPRRRRRAKQAEPGAEPKPLPLTRVTAVRAQEPFDSVEDAQRWLDDTLASDAGIEAAVAEGMALLNRALHASTVASADPLGAELSPDKAVEARIGHGSGKEVASGDFAEAHSFDPRATSSSRRKRRDDELRPQERLAAILGGRERADTCETLLLRARADLDAARYREAALQLRVALEALLPELSGALADPGHEQDMTQLKARRNEAGEAANAALRGELDIERERQVTELIELCERVLRRRRVLRG